MADNLTILVDWETCQAPGYREWVAKAHKAGFRIVTGPPVRDHLRISGRYMQFRGHWDAWWLEPERLKDFRSYSEGGPTGCADANGCPSLDNDSGRESAADDTDRAGGT